MKKYSDYTNEELNRLYDDLSEDLQVVMYGRAIPEAVQEAGKAAGLHIDQMGELSSVLIETILGIVPASLFRDEVVGRVKTDAVQTSLVVDKMNELIFNEIREDLIDQKYQNKEDGVIYDESENSIEEKIVDPYRETFTPIPGSTNLITEDKLHLVDEIFGKEINQIKKLTPEDGSIRSALNESDDALNLLSLAPTKEEVEAEENAQIEAEFQRLKAEAKKEREALEALKVKEIEEKRISAGEIFVGAKKVDEMILDKEDLKKLEGLNQNSLQKFQDHLPEEFRHQLPSSRENLKVEKREENLPTPLEKNEAVISVVRHKKNPEDGGEVVITIQNSALFAKKNYESIDPYKEI